MIHYLLKSKKILCLSSFSSLSNKTFKNYLSNHIIKIIESKPQIYARCEQKFIELIEHENKKQEQNATLIAQHNNVQNLEHTIKMKLNMIFRVFSLSKVLDKYKQQLNHMIITDKIKHQSELDQTTNLLMKKIKTDKQFSLKDIEIIKTSQTNSREDFERYLNDLLLKQQKIEISALSKILRQKFANIDSKQIYQQLIKLNQKIQQLPNNSIKQNHNQKNQTQNSKRVKQFWDKFKNIKPRLLKQQLNDAQVYKKHIQITNGRLRFRFPPQPNGHLHIGHIKSIRINFETAKRQGGACYLRYDDTNPETQSAQFIQNILKNVRWLGYEPDHITYASDYFQQMLQFALQLIRQGHAYVCDSSQIEMQRQRKQQLANKDRERPIQQSLRMFPNLKEGQTLRLKLDPAAKNPTLRDPVIYRIKGHSHPRTGHKYQVYPIYDFAHCICDSLQHIDYSLCSLEFEVRRELYYKILDLLRLYKPSVWQYSRLNVEGTLVSKRKIKALIESKAIQSWSDPRLLTIQGLINRGYTPSMLLSFIDKVNASRAGNQNFVQFSLLQLQMKKQLFTTSQKSMMVLEPTKLHIQQIDQQAMETVEIGLYTDPQRPQTRKISLTQTVFVQANSDIFQVGKIIVLKYAGVFQIIQVGQKGTTIRKLNQTIKQLKQNKKQFKVLHWISSNQCIQCPTILFEKLLQKQQVNKNSKKTFAHALIPKDVYEHKGSTNKYWQMERLGYFKFDGQGNFIRCTALAQK